jgi:hypothetical protein
MGTFHPYNAADRGALYELHSSTEENTGSP